MRHRTRYPTKELNTQIRKLVGSTIIGLCHIRLSCFHLRWSLTLLRQHNGDRQNQLDNSPCYCIPGISRKMAPLSSSFRHDPQGGCSTNGTEHGLATHAQKKTPGFLPLQAQMWTILYLLSYPKTRYRSTSKSPNQPTNPTQPNPTHPNSTQSNPMQTNQPTERVCFKCGNNQPPTRRACSKCTSQRAYFPVFSVMRRRHAPCAPVPRTGHTFRGLHAIQRQQQ